LRRSAARVMCWILETNGGLEQAYAEADVAKKWAASSWAKGIAKKAAKADMGDFDRFQMMVARKTRVRWRVPVLCRCRAGAGRIARELCMRNFLTVVRGLVVAFAMSVALRAARGGEVRGDWVPRGGARCGLTGCRAGGRGAG